MLAAEAPAPGDCAFDIGTKPAAENAGEIESNTDASKPEAIIGTAIGRSIALMRVRSD